MTSEHILRALQRPYCKGCVPSSATAGFIYRVAENAALLQSCASRVIIVASSSPSKGRPHMHVVRLVDGGQTSTPSKSKQEGLCEHHSAAPALNPELSVRFICGAKLVRQPPLRRADLIAVAHSCQIKAGASTLAHHLRVLFDARRG